jgi:hypothetical protein
MTLKAEAANTDKLGLGFRCLIIRTLGFSIIGQLGYYFRVIRTIGGRPNDNYTQENRHHRI